MDGAQRPMTATLKVAIVMPHPLFFFLKFYHLCVYDEKLWSLVLLVSECYKNDGVS